MSGKGVIENNSGYFVRNLKDVKHIRKITIEYYGTSRRSKAPSNVKIKD